MIDIGHRIKELRLQSGLSGKELSASLDVSQSFISALEKGAKKCSLENLDKICETLGVTLSEFFAEESPEMPYDIRKIVELAKHMPPKQRERLIQLMETMVDDE